MTSVVNIISQLKNYLFTLSLEGALRVLQSTLKLILLIAQMLKLVLTISRPE